MKVANIPIALVVDGRRTVIPAGAEIPDGLSDRDTWALLASGAMTDADAAAQAKLEQAARKLEADAPFQAARQAARDAAQSTQLTQPPPPPNNTPPNNPPPERVQPDPSPMGQADKAKTATTARKKR